MKYVLEKLVDGEWCHWGNYDTPDSAARAAFGLGRCASAVENVRVVEEAKPVHEEPQLEGQMSIGGCVRW